VRAVRGAEELVLDGPAAAAFVGAPAHSAYRGGVWESAIAVDGLSAPLVVTSPQRLAPNAPVGLTPVDGWILPG